MHCSSDPPAPAPGFMQALFILDFFYKGQRITGIATLYYLFVAFIHTVHAYKAKSYFRNVLLIPPGKRVYQTFLTKFNFITKSNNKQQAFGNTNRKMT